MPRTKTLTIAEAKKRLDAVIADLREGAKPVIITEGKKRVAVMISLPEYESLLETIGILSNADEVAAIKEGFEQIAHGEFVTYEELFGAKDKRHHKAA